MLSFGKDLSFTNQLSVKCNLICTTELRTLEVYPNDSINNRAK